MTLEFKASDFGDVHYAESDEGLYTVVPPSPHFLTLHNGRVFAIGSGLDGARRSATEHWDGSAQARALQFFDAFRLATAAAFESPVGQRMRAEGWTPVHTGGGCMAWEKRLPGDRHYLWICDESLGLGESLTETFLCGLYEDDAADQQARYENGEAEGIDAALAWCREREGDPRGYLDRANPAPVDLQSLDALNLEGMATRIAEAFVAILAADLPPETFAEMRRRNKTAAYTSACASHDFCDANMPMAAAFETVAGREPDVGDAADVGLWNRAWDIARARYLGSPRA